MFLFHERLLTGSCQIISRQLKYSIYPDNNSINTAVQASPMQLYLLISIQPRRNSNREKGLWWVSWSLIHAKLLQIMIQRGRKEMGQHPGREKDMGQHLVREGWGLWICSAWGREGSGETCGALQEEGQALNSSAVPGLREMAWSGRKRRASYLRNGLLRAEQRHLNLLDIPIPLGTLNSELTEGSLLRFSIYTGVGHKH